MSNEKMETKKSDKFLSTLKAAQKGDADAQFNLGVIQRHINTISWLPNREISMHKSNWVICMNTA